MGDVLDLAGNCFVRQRGCGHAGLGVFQSRHDFIMCLLDQIAPCSRDGSGVAIVSSVVD
jgi:hypothetical protein